MSLHVDDGGRARSRSPAGRGSSPNVVDATPYPSSTVGFDDPASTAFEYQRLAKWPSASPYGNASDDDDDHYHRPEIRYAEPPRTADYRYPSDRDNDRERDSRPPVPPVYLPAKYQTMSGGAGDAPDPRQSRDSVKDRMSEKERKKAKYEEDMAYGKLPGPSRKERKEERREDPPPSSNPVYPNYAQHKPYEYAKPDERLTYNTALNAGRVPSPGHHRRESGNNYTSDARLSDPRLADPRFSDPRLSDPRLSASILTVEPPGLKPAMKREKSPQPPVGRMSSLTVNTPHHSAHLSLSAAPPSPLLEAYTGTYQTMSPMPSPMLLPTDPRISSGVYSPIDSDDERQGQDEKKRRRARFHDPVDDAARLAKALKGDRRAPETEPLIEILPGMTHEQIMELRAEYKRLVKTGADRKGVNVAKHIRARLKDEDPNLMKACYATALGRWESEAYWANFWYHGDKTRRELLIESLMGRTNDEIRAIKDGFSDKKYRDSLRRCMETELKEDKFKKAVLMVLEETRMDETDAYGRPLRIDQDLVRDDAKQLHHAVRSEKGGETLMITIVTQRSDSHLREVMQYYKEAYRGANFAKDALRKSGNLVVCFLFFLTP